MPSGTLGALAVACQTAYAALGVSAADAAGLPPAGALTRLWDDKQAAPDIQRAAGH
jgi:hypothetical protein